MNDETANGAGRGGDGGIPAVRIFLSSPGDVAEERAVALSVLRRLQGWFQGRLLLVPILWEQEPLLASAGFQQEIDRRAPPRATDVAVFVLWSRLGTPLSKDFVLEDGRRPTGTEWEFEDASKGHAEQGAPDILVYRKGAPPPGDLGRGRQELLDRLAQFEAVGQFFQRHFQHATDLSFRGSFHEFPDAAHFGQLFEAHLTKLLTERLAGAQEVATWHGSPFRGLEAFEPEHAPVFFGRTRAIQEVRQALARQVKAGRAFVLILGPSGNGKSSLARAGLLPMLDAPWVLEEGLEGGLCRRAVMTPGAGRTPLEALAGALLCGGALSDLNAHGSAADLAALFAESPKAAVSHVRGSLRRAALSSACAGSGGESVPARLVLLVDQVEEMFTREGVMDADREAFVRVLDALARSGDTWVLATLRSDHYPAYARWPLLMALKEGGGHYDLALPDASETAQIIRGPAQVAGLRYEVDAESGRSLDEALLSEAMKGPDSLPLLEYALTQLEQHKRGNLLTLEAYRAMGGLEGAIRERAEQTWAALTQEERNAFPTVLRALVEVGDGGAESATRRRTPYEEVTRTTAAKALVDAFVRARLLVAEGEGAGGTVRVAHEALLRAWPRAADRISAEAELLRIRSRVRTQAARWQEQGRERSLLLAEGRPLGEVRLLGAARFELTDVESAYVTASERRARRTRILRRAAVLAIALLAAGASVLGLRAGASAREARGFADLASERERAARASEVRARANAFLSASREASATNSMMALALAREAVRLTPSPKAFELLRTALNRPLDLVRFLGHDEGVHSAVISPDGQRVLTASGDMTARLWDLSGKELAVLRGHKGKVWGATFSPDGQRVLTASEDKTARLFDLSGKELTALQGHEGGLWKAIFSPDGQRVLTASNDQTVRLWDLSGKELAVWRGREGRVSGAAFTRDGPRVLTVSDHATVRLWDLSGKELAVMSGDRPSVSWATFTPDGQRVLSTGLDNAVRLWDLSGKELGVLEGHESAVFGAVLSPDGEHVLTASADKTARLWSLSGGDRRNSGVALAIMRGHEDGVSRCTFSPDGQRVLTVSRDKTTRVWDLSGKELAVLRGHEGQVYSAVFSADGRRVLTASQDKTARFWDLSSPQFATLGGDEFSLDSAEFSPDGQRVLTASRDKTARLWDLSGRELAVLRGHAESVSSAVFSPDGRRVVTGSYDGTARLWDLSGKELAVLRGHEDGVFGCAFSPDGQRVLTASRDKTARLWDLSGKELAVLRGHEEGVHSAVFSPDGQRVLTASGDKTARLWDRSGKELAVLRGHESSLESAAFSPDGQRVLTASADKTARLWDLSGKGLTVFGGHEGRVYSAIFSPDGQHVLSASDDDTVRLWSLTGKELSVLPGHTCYREHVGWVHSAAFSADGLSILTAPEDGTIRLWDLSGKELAVLKGHGLRVDSVEFSPDGQRILTASYWQGPARLRTIGGALLLEVADRVIPNSLLPEERRPYADLLESDAATR